MAAQPTDLAKVHRLPLAGANDEPLFDVTPPSALPESGRPLVSSRAVRVAVSLASAILPWSIRRRLLSLLFGWGLHPTARIGVSIVDVEDLRMGADAEIGHGNFVSRLRRLQMGERAHIGKLNWIRLATALAPQDDDEAPGELIMGDASGMTGQHFVDCSGGLYFGTGAMLGGARTTVMTHQVDVMARRQRGLTTYIGDRALVASNCTVCPGTTIGRESLIAMGSNARGDCDERGVVYAGNPARPRGPWYAPEDDYFNFT